MRSTTIYMMLQDKIVAARQASQIGALDDYAKTIGPKTSAEIDARDAA